MCHVNCQSLLSHFSDFAGFFGHDTFDLIALSETWLKHVPDNFIQLQGYHIVRNDREGKEGGGLGSTCGIESVLRLWHRRGRSTAGNRSICF